MSTFFRLSQLLQGARQVGKTWLMKYFGENYFENVCYINFERTQRVKRIFDGDYDVQHLLEQLSVETHITIKPQTTLIIFDEIQEAPNAITALKYFAEDAPEYAICCAGSLLGVSLHNGISFPVGKVQMLTVSPMSFREFLLAHGEGALVDYMLKYYNTEPYREKLESYLKSYFIVGGMPAVVNDWIENRDYYKVGECQDDILMAYQADFSKYTSPSTTQKINYVWQSLTTQLAKENKKFIYGIVRTGARAREYEDALQWLYETGLIRLVYNVNAPKLPLRAYANLQCFKVYLLDIGLLRQMSGLSPRVILEGNRVFEEFKGSLTEQYVLQELSLLPHVQCGFYWTSGNSAEVDFLLDDGNNIMPVEVKSGINVHAKSLKVYDEHYHPNKQLRFSLLPFGTNGTLMDIPLYMVFSAPWMPENQ